MLVCKVGAVFVVYIVYVEMTDSFCSLVLILNPFVLH